MEKVKNILQQASGNKYDIYYTLYDEHILKSDQPLSIFSYILKFNDKIGDEDDSPADNFSAEEIKSYERKYRDLINEIVWIIAQDNPEEDVFYQKVYDNIFGSSLIPENKKICSIILKILSENVGLIPYYQAKDLLKMDNSIFKNRFEELKNPIVKGVHMLNRRFETLTEMVSQIYRTSMELENEEDKIVFWSALFGIIMHDSDKDEN